MPEPKRILIVGAGSIGLKHVRAFTAADPRVELYVMDPSQGARERAAAAGARTLDVSWEELDVTDCDGVVICAPAPMHVPYAARCLREGVPVLSEKPLSHSWDGVPELVRLSRKSRAPVSGVAYVRRYHPAHEAMRGLVASGSLGPMHVLRINSGQPFTTYRPDYKRIYYASREQGGGCVLDFASHFIDLAQYYLGRAKSVRGYAGHLALEGVGVEDTAALTFEFDGGELGTLNINQYQPLNENCIELCGPEACLRITEPGFTCRVWRAGSDRWEDIAVEPGDYLDALRRQAAAFLAAIDGGPPMRTSIADSAHTLRLCLDVLGD